MDSNHQGKARHMIALAFILVFALIAQLVFCPACKETMKSQDGFSTWTDVSRQPVGTIKAASNDSCGLFQSGSHWSLSTAEEIQMLREIETCAMRFSAHDHKFYKKFDRQSIQILRCQTNITKQTAQAALTKHGTVWFFGDSILLQQFYSMVCMLNPNVTVQDMNYYKPAYIGSADDRVTGEYHHAATNTTLRMTRFGLHWDKEENNLYKLAFPQAVASLSESDAIVLDAGAHYSAAHAPLMKRALDFVKDQQAAAKIYYVEPSPEEWPTSNGMYQVSCYKKCQCQALTNDQIRGQGVHASLLTGTSQEEVPVDFFQKHLAAAAGDHPKDDTTAWIGANHSACYPNCLPATWRVDLARSILSESTVTIVPVWWQLVDNQQTPNYAKMGDCTHKSFQAITMMNQQLIRSMLAVHQQQ